MNKRFFFRIVAAVAILASSLLTGCASIVNGSSQPVTVEARSQGQAVIGARCKLQNAKGTFYVTSPGTVTIHKSGDDLVVRCEKENIQPGLATVKSTVKGMTFGNILFGGIIGTVVDQSSGAAFDYPNAITVLMGENGATPLATAAHNGSPGNPAAPAVPALPDTPGIPGRYAERQLTVEEMRIHFTTLGTVFGHNPSGAKMQYDISQDGGLEARNLDKGGSGMGLYEIKEADNKICIGMYGSSFRSMQDCYRLYQVGPDKFAMRSATDNYYFTYIKQQPFETAIAIAEQPVAAHAVAAHAAAQLTDNHAPAPLPPASAAAPVPAAAPTPELPADQTGQYSYQSEHLARAQSCSAAPRAVLNAKGPGFESYTVPCDNGDALAMRCDFGQCRILK